jgi:hypothetical protein
MIQNLLGAIKGDYLGDPSKEVFFDIFADERMFMNGLKAGLRSCFSTRDTATDDLITSSPTVGVYGTRGTSGVSEHGSNLTDGLASAFTVGLKDNQFGLHGEGDLFQHGKVTIDEFTHIYGPLTVEQATELMYTLLVKGVSTFEGNVEFKKETHFEGNETHDAEAGYEKGKIKIPSGNLVVDGKGVGQYVQDLVVSTITGTCAAGPVVLTASVPADTGAA